MSWLDEAELGNARVEDIAWLSSLSDSELDVLISLKKLVMQRAKVIGHENLIEKFDVKLLRALGVVLLEYIKERVKSSSAFSTHPEVSTILNQCRLSTTSPEGGVSSVVADEGSKKIDSFMKQEKMDED